MADNTNSQAPTLTEQVGQKAKEQTQQVKEQAQQAVQHGQQTAGHVWELGRNHFRSALTAQKNRAAGGLGDVADLIKQAGSQLREQGSAGGGQIAENLSERFAQFSSTVREKEIEEILADTEKFGRSNPVAFLSLAALIGFVLARFLKSSGQAASAA